MLLSRKRGRDMGDVLPVLQRPDRHIDETWFLRDLRATDPARSQVLEFLQRHNRADEADEANAADQGNSARLSSQELFLSVVLEWQRAGADDRAVFDHPADAWRLPAAPESAYSSSVVSDSDSEVEDERQRRRPNLKLTEDESPTSVYAVPQTLTPLRLDAVALSAPVKKIGVYTPRARRELLRRYMAKRAKRLSQHTVRYRVRKTLANARPRVKGRFVKTQQPLTAAAVEAMKPSSGEE